MVVKPRSMIRVVTMLRVAAVLCVLMLMQAQVAGPLLKHSVCQSACPEDGSDDGRSLTDEALVVERVVIAHPSSPRLHHWNGPRVAAAPSPAPDEILHVPKQLLA